MSDQLDLDRLRRSLAEYHQLWNRTPLDEATTETRMVIAACSVADQVPALLAELERLQQILASDAPSQRPRLSAVLDDPEGTP